MADSPNRGPASQNVVAAVGLQALQESEFRLLRDLIFEKSGITLSDSKQQLVASRLARRLRARGLSRYRDYFDLVTHGDPQGDEMRELLNAITTNKTDFFRENHHFEFMRNTFFPQIVERARQTNENKLRIWSAGCSTGEEPYTLAMTALSWFPPDGRWSIEILATDLDTNVLERAHAGVYGEEIVAPVPEAMLKRYFQRGTGANAGKVRVNDELRRLISFRQLNFVQQPWWVKETFDLILCRNVMIYFNQETQRTLVEGFAGHLRPEGYLFIGHSENLNGVSHLFEPLRGTIYRRRRSGEVADGSAPARPPAAPPAERPPAAAPGSGQPGLAPLPNAAPLAGRTPDRRSTRTPKVPPPAPPSGASRPTFRVSDADGRAVERVNIIIGGVHASRDVVQLRTVLGSCVCACLYDPAAKIGGINHFMLPDGLEDRAMPTRFGVNAMEVLINEILKLGGERRRLVAKAFGAAHVLSDAGVNPEVPRKNAKFIKEFLAKEEIPLLSSRLGGSAAVEVVFTTDSGRALVRALGDAVARDLAREESRHDLEIAKQLIRPQEGSVELF